MDSQPQPTTVTLQMSIHREDDSQVAPTLQAALAIVESSTEKSRFKKIPRMKIQKRPQGVGANVPVEPRIPMTTNLQ